MTSVTNICMTSQSLSLLFKNIRFTFDKYLEITLRDPIQRLEDAENRGLEIGFEKGIEQGIERGTEQRSKT